MRLRKLRACFWLAALRAPFAKLRVGLLASALSALQSFVCVDFACTMTEEARLSKRKALEGLQREDLDGAGVPRLTCLGHTIVNLKVKVCCTLCHIAILRFLPCRWPLIPCSSLTRADEQDEEPTANMRSLTEEELKSRPIVKAKCVTA